MVTRPAHAAPASDFRPDIEGMRAIAVLAVLLYHARLAGFDGGYIGVDVFFVLSGFLITRLLVREVDTAGRVSLPSFWARRARRLLPASTLVLVTTLVASRFMLDPLTQGFVGRSALAASAFAANLLFWTRGGYSQLALPEPLLHFWSLAVEEQFYLFWPLILFAIARLGGHFRRLVVAVAAPIAVASLVACIALTRSRQPFAFYWLPTRAWELMAGALVAVLPLRALRAAPFARGFMGWLGLMVLGLCFVWYHDPQDGFPGALALLPVACTVAVILGGTSSEFGPERLLRLAPLQWVGRHSYAIYLWHFPVLVLSEAKWGPLGWGTRLGLLVLSALLATISFRLVEDPVRRSTLLAVRPLRSVAMGAALVTVGLVGAGVLLASKQGVGVGEEVTAPTLVVDSAPQVVDGVGVDTTSVTASVADDSIAPVTSGSGSAEPVPDSTTAPTATTRPSGNPPALAKLASDNAALMEEAVATRVVPKNLEPSLSEVYADRAVVYDDGCLLGNGQTMPKECVYGDTTATKSVVLFGDSHAAQWFPAFEAVAREQGFRLIVLAKKHCPAGDVPQPESGYTTPCSRWRANVYERIEREKPTVVVMSSLWYRGVPFSTYQKGWERTFAEVKQHAQHVVYLADTPIRKTDVPSCVSARSKSVNQCTVTRRSAINPTRLRSDRAATRNQGVDHIYPDDWLCGKSRCAVIVGNVLLYRDQTHLTVAAAKFLTPYISAMMRPYIVGEVATP